MSFETRISVLLLALLGLAIGADLHRGSATPGPSEPPRKYLMDDDHVYLTQTSEREGVLTATFSVRPTLAHRFQILSVLAEGFELLDQLPVAVVRLDDQDSSIRTASVQFRRLDGSARFGVTNIEYVSEQ